MKPIQNWISMLTAVSSVVALAPTNLTWGDGALYDFENPALILGSEIDGKDNWKGLGFGLKSPTLATGTGVNTSQAIRWTSDSFENYASRINNGNFGYAIDFTKSSVIGMDVTWATSGNQAGLALGVDSNGSGDISSHHSSCATCFAERTDYLLWQQSGAFYYGNNLSSSVSGPGTYAQGEWVRMRLVIDWTQNFSFTAFGTNYYNGAGSLYAMNLSDGETTFTPMALNFDLGAEAGNWSYWARNSSPDALGVFIRQRGDSVESLIDNIYVPEPSSILLLGLGGVLLRRKRTT